MEKMISVEEAEDILFGFTRTNAWLQHEAAAVHEAKRLSVAYERVFRVYRTPAGNFWVRRDPEPVAQVNGMDLVHLHAYLKGEEVKP